MKEPQTQAECDQQNARRERAWAKSERHAAESRAEAIPFATMDPNDD